MAEATLPEIGLLLADADDGRPLLDGLLTPGDCPVARLGHHLKGDLGGDPNALDAQRWGIIAAPGAGPLIEKLAPLLALRREQQGAEVHLYEVPACQDERAAAEWLDLVYLDPEIEESERPRYLLLVGNFDGVSLELQQALEQHAFVGRLCFSAPDGRPVLEAYGAYADKVCRAERGPRCEPRALTYLARDGSEACRLADAGLVSPFLETARKWRDRGLIAGLDVLSGESPEPEELLLAARDGASSLLFTVAHGAGAPAAGWRSFAEQRSRQGVLLLPPPRPRAPRKVISPAAVETGPFLPGGVWFCFSCFGAGTPARSDYHPWLSLLARKNQTGGDIGMVLASLAMTPHPPFVAALPQAALANPDGPLAVFGHVDLAFSYSFGGNERGRSRRAAKFATALEQLVRGRRAGVALDALMRDFREVNNDLAKLQQRRQQSPAGAQEDPDGVLCASLFMLRNDLKNFMLLGDPAVRLPVDVG